MNLIKPLLIVSFLALLIWAFRHRSSVEMRVGLRILAIVMTGLAVASIAEPGLTQRAADAVGVARGTDLLLYGMVVVFAFTAVGAYFRFSELERRLVQVVRKQGITEALLRDGPPGLGTSDPDQPTAGS